MLITFNQPPCDGVRSPICPHIQLLFPTYRSGYDPSGGVEFADSARWNGSLIRTDVIDESIALPIELCRIILEYVCAIIIVNY